MAETHIASFLVQHRLEAVAGLDACIAAQPGLELARREGTRSIVLCESDAPRVLMDRIDLLREVQGVLQVSLVYHHVEPADSLDQPLEPGTAAPRPPDTGVMA